jgi:hypothetical protein
VRGGPQLPERHPGRGLRQDRISIGRVSVGKHADLVFDDADVDRVDLPGGQRGEGPGQPAGHLRGVIHLAGRR